MPKFNPHNGIARNATQAQHPYLWRGLRLALSPRASMRGAILVDYAGRNNGNLYSGVTPEWQAEHDGPALYYNGINNQTRVTTAYSEALGDFTAAAWFRSTGVGASGYDRIIEKGYDTGFVVCRIASSANTWGAYVVDASASSPVSVTLTDGDWNHIAVTRRGDLVTVYGNGGKVVSSATRVSTATSTNSVSLGWSSAAYGWNPFMGRIGEVLVYNRALSAGEVQSLYCGATPLMMRKRLVYFNNAGAAPAGLPFPVVSAGNGIFANRGRILAA